MTRSGFERETWEHGDRLLKEIDIFGWLRFHETLPGALQPDRHPGVYEIHYLKRGHLNWWVEDTTYEFRPGSVFIVRPDQLHGGDEESLQPCEHLWLRLSLDGEKACSPLFPPRRLPRCARASKAFSTPLFPVSTVVGDYLDRMLAEHRTP